MYIYTVYICLCIMCFTLILVSTILLLLLLSLSSLIDITLYGELFGTAIISLLFCLEQKSAKKKNRNREKERKMSSPLKFKQRLAPINDLATSSSSTKPVTSFFLRSSLLSDSDSCTFPSQFSQSLVSLVRPLPAAIPPPSRPCQLLSSHVANIINQFESRNVSSMNNKQNKLSRSNRSIFNQEWERNHYPASSNFAAEPTSTYIPFNFKVNNKPQPIIVYERIGHDDESSKPGSISSSIDPRNSFEKSYHPHKTTSQPNAESDTDSAVHTMPTVINADINHASTLSRSSTTNSICSSLSSSISSVNPHFVPPVFASIQKQCDIPVDSTSCKSACSPRSSPVITIRTNSSTSSTINDGHQSSKSHSLNTRFCLSEENLADQYRRLSSPDAIQSDTNLSQTPIKQVQINTNLPLRYKRDSFIRLYG